MSNFIIECRSCGAQIECTEGMQTAVCRYCGSLNTVGIKTESSANLYNRANYLRRTGEFDKAIGVYEEILNKDHTDAEAHWGIVLCRYGIEYVEDPLTKERIPTCHRAQYDSIYIDPNYKAAIEYASYDAKQVYESEALRIDRIQKGILALAKKEERYDVFICYKESDVAGNRTQDSVLGQEIYYELTKKGYRVFYARKTLEGKLGSAYEPVIFAALNSAKIMVVIGTKPEHLNSVWVKNEWGRYRERLRKGEDVHIIPAYRDMSPYDLPQEFSNLQALDMSRIGFIHDLMDGIDKLMRKEQQSVNKAEVTPNTGYEPLLKRAYLFLEDGDFKNADAYFEKVLDQNPEEARAYIGKLLVLLKLRKPENLVSSRAPLTEYEPYNKALRFATPAQKKEYEGYNKTILDRIEEERLEEERTKERERLEEERRRELARIEQARLEERRRLEEEQRKEMERIEEAQQKERERIEEAIFNERRIRLLPFVGIVIIIYIVFLMVSNR